MNRAEIGGWICQKGFVKLEPFLIGEKKKKKKKKGKVRFVLWFELRSYHILFLHPKKYMKKHKRSDVLC